MKDLHALPHALASVATIAHRQLFADVYSQRSDRFAAAKSWRNSPEFRSVCEANHFPPPSESLATSATRLELLYNDECISKGPVPPEHPPSTPREHP